MKNLSRHHQVSVGILGLTLCLVVIPSGGMVGQQGVSHAQESEVADGQAPTSWKERKAQRWTVPCEREDGTQGIFRVLSNVTDEASPLDIEADIEPVETVEMVEAPPTPHLKEPASTEDQEHDDPFGSPTLKCGRLLTLLAIFASGESRSP